MSRRRIAVGYGSAPPYVAAYKFDTWEKLPDPADAIDGDVNSIAYSPDGTLCAVGYFGSANLIIYDTTVVPWVKITDPGTMPALAPEGLEFSADGAFLAAGSGATELLVYDTSDWSDAASTPAEIVGTVKDVSWSPDGAYLAAAQLANNPDGIIVFETTGWTQVAIEAPPDQMDWGFDVSFSPDGAYMVGATFDANSGGYHLVVWETTGWTIVDYKPLRNPVEAIAWKPDSSEFLTAAYDIDSEGKECWKYTVPGFARVRFGDVPVGASSAGLAYSWDGRYVYLTVDYDVNFLVLNADDGSVADVQPNRNDTFFNPEFGAYGWGLSLPADDGSAEVESTLPLFTLLGLDTTEYVYDYLPLLTLDADGQPGSDAAVTLPQFTLDASDGDGKLIQTLPSLTMAGVGTDVGGVLNSTLPALLGSAEGGEVGTYESAALETLPVLQGTGTGGSGVIAQVIDDLPRLTLYAYGDEGVAEVLPALTLSASGKAGVLASLDAALPPLALSASGEAPSIQTADEMYLPVFTIAAAGFVEGLGDTDVGLPAMRISAAGESGVVATLDEALPVFTLDALGYGQIQADAAVLLPMLMLDAVGFAQIPETFRTWVLNLHNKALTEYTQWGFNSFARFRGTTLAASAGGVVVLDDQDQDDDQPIVASVRGGVHDYDNIMMKRMEYAYTGIKADSDLYLRLLTKEGGTQTYILRGGGPNLESRRVVLARGVRSRYWQWEIANLAEGNDFELKHLALYPESTSRRVNAGSS